jgi:transposase InsO family protein
LKNKKLTSIAKLYIDEVVTRHGAVKTLLSDQGGEFMSDLVRDICVYLKTSKVNTTVYHPQTNGLTERFNATLCQILSIYVDLNQQNWDELLPIVLFAYRTAVQETTTISPFEALYNRMPRLPNDLDLVRIDNKIVREFDKNWILAKEKVRLAGYIGSFSFKIFCMKYNQFHVMVNT